MKRATRREHATGLTHETPRMAAADPVLADGGSAESAVGKPDSVVRVKVRIERTTVADIDVEADNPQIPQAIREAVQAALGIKPNEA